MSKDKTVRNKEQRSGMGNARADSENMAAKSKKSQVAQEIKKVRQGRVRDIEEWYYRTNIWLIMKKRKILI